MTSLGEPLGQHPKGPLHGITLEAMLTQLVEHYGLAGDGPAHQDQVFQLRSQ